VPCGLARGLPAGISFVARRWDEEAALRAGRAWELVRGAFPAPPVG
jgi:Asp-tRNA(Asn)/Glu-tRNA(Gln) amidotransferase A subunit family amidase